MELRFGVEIYKGRVATRHLTNVIKNFVNMNVE